MMIARKPDESLGMAYLAYCRDFLDRGEAFHACENAHEVERRIARDRDFEAGRVDGDKVQQLTFWFFDEDNHMCGTSRLRLRLNEYLERCGGHIGYDVCPSCRRKGYGTEILAFMLHRAAENGLSRVLLTCEDRNAASARIIEKNGGQLSDRIEVGDMKTLMRRYWIDVPASGDSPVRSEPIRQKES